ncbi:MAG TPA: CDP-alcohol phosphatidyltransferase family protein [Pyrinomonadaceae bacterium]
MEDDDLRRPRRPAGGPLKMMFGDATRQGWGYRLRLVAPQVLTGSRVVFGAAAVITALDGRLYPAAVLITFGAVTDVLDGLLARRLGVAGAFGALFDTFTDYFCFVIAPWALTRAIVAPGGGVILETLIGLPLLTGAVRYARNSLLIVAAAGEVRELPGLATVFFAFLPVAAVFLDAPALVGEPRLPALMTFLVVTFSLLMVTSLRYPKLNSFRWLPAPVLVASLAAMPFLGTRILAGVMLVAGLLYVAFAHLLTRGRPRARRMTTASARPATRRH